MTGKHQDGKSGIPIWDMVREKLHEHGVDLDVRCCEDEEGESRFRVVCVADDLHASVREMGKKLRDQVVMVRVDEETCGRLDAWVEAGAVRSRSEAAALFIREGLKVRASELEQLKEALDELERAKEKLRRQASRVFGADQEEDEPSGDS